MIMINILLMKKTAVAEEMSTLLGFSQTLFLETEVVVLEGMDKKKLLQDINLAKSKKKMVVYKVTNEEMLRFVLEKTAVDMVIGIEGIHEKDSLQHVRGGLDDVFCKIATDKEKIIGFSFEDVLNCGYRDRLMARMMLNIKLCKKYKVKMIFSNFSSSVEEMRSVKDLEAFGRLLGI